MSERPGCGSFCIEHLWASRAGLAHSYYLGANDVTRRSEAKGQSGRELDLLQRALAEAERIAEVARFLVAERRRLIPELHAHAAPLREEDLGTATQTERQLGLGRLSEGIEERRAQAGKQERTRPLGGVPQPEDDVAVQLIDGHLEQVLLARRGSDFEP